MTKSKRVMRRLILSKLYECLADQYPVIYPRDVFVSGDLPLHELEALLAFRSDPHLEELRHALDRLDKGTYGICLSCKSSINQEVLDADPAQRMCSACEHKLMHIQTSSYFHHVTT